MLISDQKHIDKYYKALIDRDDSYVGIFYVGVRTTGVFCIATCRARKPKKVNVLFYSTFKDALDNGYRPCKICKPTENANEAPQQVRQAIELIKNNPKQKVGDYQLKQLSISPSLVRRWFKKHYGMTFQAFQRMYRVNVAFQELKKGKSATNVAFESGYESLSGFGYTFKKLIGKPPRLIDEQKLILISRITSPLGPMFICATDNGICLLEFVDRRMLETEFKDLQRLLKAKIINGDNSHIALAKKELAEYFKGTRKEFSVPLDAPGSEFQQEAWKGLQKISYGTTSTYEDQAKLIGRPTAIRAIASANGHNRISILVPCHRVLRKDGNLGGYGGGLERKQWLLDHEKRYGAQKSIKH